MEEEPQPIELPREEEAKQMFRFEQWLLHMPLNRWTVLDYFKYSQFYDRTSNNEILAMQGLDMSQLTSMQGIEYILVCESNAIECPYYLIYKQRRFSEKDAELLCVYYVIGEDLPADPANGRTDMLPKGTLFPMPDLHAVLAFNTGAAVYHISKAVEALQQCVSLEAKQVSTTMMPTDDNSKDSLFSRPTSDASAAQFMATFKAFQEGILDPLVQAAQALMAEEAEAHATAASTGTSTHKTEDHV